jgi:hypothetical protein
MSKSHRAATAFESGDTPTAPPTWRRTCLRFMTDLRSSAPTPRASRPVLRTPGLMASASGWSQPRCWCPWLSRPPRRMGCSGAGCAPGLSALSVGSFRGLCGSLPGHERGHLSRGLLISLQGRQQVRHGELGASVSQGVSAGPHQQPPAVAVWHDGEHDPRLRGSPRPRSHTTSPAGDARCRCRCARG